MLAEIDDGERSPLLLFRSRFPQQALAADALRTRLSWRQQRRFARLWRPYHFLWQMVDGVGAMALRTPPSEHAVDQIRRRLHDLLDFLQP